MRLEQADPQAAVGGQDPAQDEVHDRQLRLDRVGAQVQHRVVAGVAVDTDGRRSGSDRGLVEGQRDAKVLHGRPEVLMGGDAPAGVARRRRVGEDHGQAALLAGEAHLLHGHGRVVEGAIITGRRRLGSAEAKSAQ